jgi:Flp pilus assembly pilin Flp
MTWLRRTWCSLRCQRAATSAEYAIMVGLIAVVIFGAVTALGLAVLPLFDVPIW